MAPPNCRHRGGMDRQSGDNGSTRSAQRSARLRRHDSSRRRTVAILPAGEEGVMEVRLPVLARTGSGRRIRPHRRGQLRLSARTRRRRRHAWRLQGTARNNRGCIAITPRGRGRGGRRRRRPPPRRRAGRACPAGVGRDARSQALKDHIRRHCGDPCPDPAMDRRAHSCTRRSKSTRATVPRLSSGWLRPEPLTGLVRSASGSAAGAKPLNGTVAANHGRYGQDRLLLTWLGPYSG